jgi:hypothetical protein
VLIHFFLDVSWRSLCDNTLSVKVNKIWLLGKNTLEICQSYSNCHCSLSYVSYLCGLGSRLYQLTISATDIKFSFIRILHTDLSFIIKFNFNYRKRSSLEGKWDHNRPLRNAQLCLFKAKPMIFIKVATLNDIISLHCIINTDFTFSRVSSSQCRLSSCKNVSGVWLYSGNSRDIKYLWKYLHIVLYVNYIIVIMFRDDPLTFFLCPNMLCFEILFRRWHWALKLLTNNR